MIQGLFTLILFRQDSDSVRSPSVFNRSASVSTTAVMNVPMWNTAWIKSGSLATVSATRGFIEEDFQVQTEQSRHQ
jgi:hypothetical protein